ncbi:GNAT family N-acetyltransferase [Aquabacterium sp. OR-4]|uniref:GNAT family N-acetyltransferase n=1 Tax=Aquabacterium sp. OR-4 TaxID=2978127 RepID=UPI0021B2ACD4|nr:GNAT family N-acetyltransferase [Aquabacterium sp. OR-4]MDT7837694.1 GNAT family N-acetyltransferase [Aquabacterium sp. OR-4]
MKRTLISRMRKSAHDALRDGLSLLPQSWRFEFYRAMVKCDPTPDPRLELKIAETQEELEDCFRILHDSYVSAGFMKPDPSGLRVTIYHALPTTTTLCAKWDGKVVGTISIIREGVFGFPLQSVFDLTAVRAKGGKITEVSSLAVDPRYRGLGGQVLFPLMKFMREYARDYFDTRHLVIAVNPNRIEMYEGLLAFTRLQACEVNNYDFANGAPAVGATLDLQLSPEQTRLLYRDRPAHRNLHSYLYVDPLANIRWPERHFHTTNDPVLTPAMMDYFFNQRTQVFETLDDRKRLLLRSIYDLDDYAGVLPMPRAGATLGAAMRQHQRFSLRCPAQLEVASYGTSIAYPLQVIELSRHGFLAECPTPLPEGTSGTLTVDLGSADTAVVEARAVRCHVSQGVTYHGFMVARPDASWQRCVDALHSGRTHRDLAPQPVQAAADTGTAPPQAMPASLAAAAVASAGASAAAAARESMLTPA